MSLKIGIVGLPNVGKSSLFNALTNNDVLVANYPFATIEPNLGTVKLLDPRIDKLTEIVNPKKVTYSTIDFLDIAGLVKGASKGEGLGNKFLEHIRSVNLICLVVRCFENKEIISVNQTIDPIFDAEIIIWELIYADIETINKTIKKLKSNDPLIGLLEKIRNHLETGKMINTLNLSDEDKQKIKNYHFLTNKLLFFLANISDGNSHVENLQKLEKYAQDMNIDLLSMNIQVELEISKLPLSEQKEYLSALNIDMTALSKLISFSFKKLGLKTFFTVGVEEVRSWTFKEGNTVQQCAGLIHTDLEKGFIKAKVTKYLDFINLPNFKDLQEAGKVMIEGKNYLTEDGDILKIEFKS